MADADAKVAAKSALCTLGRATHEASNHKITGVDEHGKATVKTVRDSTDAPSNTGYATGKARKISKKAAMTDLFSEAELEVLTAKAIAVGQGTTTSRRRKRRSQPPAIAAVGTGTFISRERISMYTRILIGAAGGIDSSCPAFPSFLSIAAGEEESIRSEACASHAELTEANSIERADDVSLSPRVGVVRPIDLVPDGVGPSRCRPIRDVKNVPCSSRESSRAVQSIVFGGKLSFS